MARDTSTTRPFKWYYRDRDEFVERPPAQVQYECPVCLQVLRDPQQVTCCGNSYCKVCIDCVVKDGKPCPTCNAVPFPIFPNKGLGRTLGGFRVYCSNKEKGCKWVGELGDREGHLNSKPSPERQHKGCLFEKVACIYCTSPFQRRYINQHQSNECPNRPFVCEHCRHSASYREITQGHYQTCLYFPIPCPNKCGIQFPRRAIERHVNQDCQLQLVACDFHGVGCQVKLPRRDVPAHFRQNVVGHSEFLLSTAQRTMLNVITVQSGQNEMQAALARLQEMVTAQENKINSVQDENRRLQARLREAVTAQENKINSVQDENKARLQKLQERQRSTNARLQHRQSQALFWGLALVCALAAIGIGIAVGNVRDKQMASAQSKPERFPLDNGIQVNESENMTVALAQNLEQVKKEVATEKKERNKMTDALAQNLTEVEKELATGKSEREKTKDSLIELDEKISMRGTLSEISNAAIDDIIEKIQKIYSAVLRHYARSENAVGLSVVKHQNRVRIDQLRRESDDHINELKRENGVELSALKRQNWMRIYQLRKKSNERINQLRRENHENLTMAKHQHFEYMLLGLTIVLAIGIGVFFYEGAVRNMNSFEGKVQDTQDSFASLEVQFQTEIDRKMTNFEKNKATNSPWYSPPFYTHTHGYKMCIRVIANGIGNGAGTHVSVSLVLMPGIFDDDLKWPFQGSVTIELINRLNPTSNLMREIHFSRTSDPAIVGKVTSGDKAAGAFGWPKFIAHSKLDFNAATMTQYLKHDSLIFYISKVTNVK